MGHTMTSSFRERVAQLASQGLTRVQQAKALGMSRSAFYDRLNAEGVALQEKMNHKDAIPWVVGADNAMHTWVQYLRELSATAQGRGPLSRFHRNTALNWAAELIMANRDITFDVVFKVIPADPEDWHIKRVYEAALRGMENE